MPTRRNVVRGLAALATVPKANAQTTSRQRSGGAGREASDFVPFTTFRSLRDGAHWVTPFGIPVPWNVLVSRTRRSRIFARKVGGDGTLHPVQTEQFKHRNATLDDDGLQHCTGHLKLPSSYVARDKWEIGYSDTASVPSAPDWNAITAAGDDFRVELSVYDPRIHYLRLTNAMSGDVVTVQITDSVGTLTYTHEFLIGFSTSWKADRSIASWHDQIVKKITQDPSGRYRCYDREVATTADWRLPWPPLSRDSNSDHRAYDVHLHPYGNHYIGHKMGWNPQGAQPGSDLSLNAPYANAAKTQRWLPSGVHIWPRAGAPIENYTIKVTCTRKGSRLPVPGIGTVGFGHKKLTFGKKTQNFSSLPCYIKGMTSGARAYLSNLSNVSGATGTLYVDGVTGDFQKGEIVVCTNYRDQTIGGSATLTSALAYQTLRSSSGGTARYLSWDGNSNSLHVSDIAGEFNPGDTLTSEFGTTTMNGARVDSTLSFDNTFNTTATSGVLSPINNSAAPSVWRATFNDASETDDSPWFDGHQVRQIERKMAFRRVGDNANHRHLEAWFRVSWSREGKVVDRSVTIENTKMRAGAIDYWYDADVRVGGASQTSGQSRYAGLYHCVWTSWQWQQAYAFGMCDPADFMLGRMIKPWKRYGSWDASAEMRYKLVGGQQNPVTNFSWTAAPVPSYVKSTLNDPLYPGAFGFHGGGGARPELGDFNSLEAIFWTSDTLATWPSLEAMADNVMNANAFNIRHDFATDERRGNSPDIYFEWYIHPTGDVGNLNHPSQVTGQINVGKPSNGTLMAATLAQLYTLTGRFNPWQSHSCSTGGYSCYLVRPTKRIFDSVRQWGWYSSQNGLSGNHLNYPAIGMAPGDPGHYQGYTFSNGVRTFTRPARDSLYAAWVSFEGSRQRTMWRRVTNDYCRWMNDFAKYTIFGLAEKNAHGRGSLQMTIRNWTPGNDAVAHPDYNFYNNPPYNGDMSVDAFKSLFVCGTALMFRNLGFDVAEYMRRATWTVEVRNMLVHGNWWNSVVQGSGSGIPIILVRYPKIALATGSDYIITGTDSAPYELLPSADMTIHKAWLESIPNAAKKDVGIFDSLATWETAVNPGSAGYCMPRLQYGAWLGYALYGDNAKLRSDAAAHMAHFDARYPVDAGSYQGGYTRAQIHQQSGYVSFAQVERW